MREARILLLMAVALALIVANYVVITNGEIHNYTHIFSNIFMSIRSYISHSFMVVSSIFGSSNYYIAYVAMYYVVIILIVISLIFAILFVSYKYLMFLEDIERMIDDLSGATFDVIRNIENCSASGWQAKKKRTEDTTARFAIDGSAKIMEQSKLLATVDGINPVDKLTDTGYSIATQVNEWAASFTSGRGVLRDIVAIIVLLVHAKNSYIAHKQLAEIIANRAKSKNYNDKDIVHLKSFFSIPRDYELGVKPMSAWLSYKVSRALRIWIKRNNNMLAIQLHDKNENGTITVRGDDAITAMRMFLHMSIEDINKESIKRTVQ